MALTLRQPTHVPYEISLRESPTLAQSVGGGYEQHGSIRRTTYAAARCNTTLPSEGTARSDLDLDDVARRWRRWVLR